MSSERFGLDAIPDHEKIMTTDGEPIMVHYNDFGRGLHSYEIIFELEPRDIDDKIVVDLGSAKHQRFAKEIEGTTLYNPKAVISVDPLYEEGVKDDVLQDLKRRGVDTSNITSEEYDKYREQYLADHPSNKNIVVARGENLPFNQSVDVILASNSVPLYLRTKESVLRSFEQMILALKPGGEARVFPLAYSPAGHGYDAGTETIEPSKIVYSPKDDGVFASILDELAEKYDIDYYMHDVWVRDPEDQAGPKIPLQALTIKKVPNQ